MKFELAECTLRHFVTEDADSLAMAANDREIWMNLRDRMPHPYTKDDAVAFISMVQSTEPQIVWAIDVDGDAVGGIGMHARDDVYRRSVEIGFWVGRSHWGRGIATAACKVITEFGLSELDICRISAEVFEWNPASCRVLEKAGYEREGRLRKAITKADRTGDSILYGRIS